MQLCLFQRAEFQMYTYRTPDIHMSTLLHYNFPLHFSNTLDFMPQSSLEYAPVLSALAQTIQPEILRATQV